VSNGEPDVVPREGFDYRSYFNDDQPISKAWEMTWRGDPAVLGETAYGKRLDALERDPRFLSAETPEARRIFFRSFGVDPTKGWGQRLPMHGGKLLKDVTIGEARKAWSAAKRKIASKNAIIVGTEVLPNTVENLIKQKEKEITIPWKDAAVWREEGGYVLPQEAEEILKKAPQYKKAVQEWILRAKEYNLPGIPRSVMRTLVQKASIDAIKQEFQEKYRPHVLKAAQFKGMPGDVAVPKPGSPGNPIYSVGLAGWMEQVDDFAKKYGWDPVRKAQEEGVVKDEFFKKERDYIRKNLHRQKHKELWGLKRKQLEPGKSFYTFLKLGDTVRRFETERYGDEIETLVKFGWSTPSYEEVELWHEERGLVPEKDPETEYGGMTRHWPESDRKKWLSVKKDFDVEDEEPSLMGRYASDRERYEMLRDMMTPDQRYDQYFEALNQALPHVDANRKMHRFYQEWKKGMGTPLVPGQYRPPHQMPGVRFGGWYMQEGYETPDEFESDLPRLLKERSENALQTLVKGGFTKDEEELTVSERLYRDTRPYGLAERRYYGIKNALASYNQRRGRLAPEALLRGGDIFEFERQQRHIAGDPQAKSIRRRDTDVKNIYGAYARSEPIDLLYAAYYDKWLPGRRPHATEPSVKHFAGLRTKLDPETQEYLPYYYSAARFPTSGGAESPVVFVDTPGESLSLGVLEEKRRRDAGAALAVERFEYEAQIDSPEEVAEYLSEQALAIPGRFAKGTAIAVGAFAESIATNIVSLSTGVEKQYMRGALRGPTAQELQSFDRQAYRFKQDTPFKKWRTEDLKIEAVTRSNKMAKENEEQLQKRLSAPLLNNIVDDLDMMVTSIFELAGLVTGRSPNEYMRSGRDWLERIDADVNSQTEMADALGRGFGNFLFDITTRPKEMLRAYPVDSVLTFLPHARAVQRKYKEQNRRVPAGIRRIITLGGRIENELGLVMKDVGVAGFEYAQNALKRAKGAMEPALESLRRKQEGFAVWFTERTGFRELNATTFLNFIYQGVRGEKDLHHLAKQVKSLGDTLPPDQFIALMNGLEQVIGKKTREQSPDLDAALTAGHKRAEAMKDMAVQEGTFFRDAPTPPMEAVGLEAARAGAKHDSLAKAIFTGNIKTIKAALHNFAKDVSMRKTKTDVAKMLGPVGTYEGIGGGLRKRRNKWDIYPAHKAVTLTRQILRGEFSAKKLNSVVAHPGTTVKELKRIRDAIADGTWKGDDLTWLFGKTVDLTRSKPELARDLLYHGFMGSSPAKRPGKVKRLISVLNNEGKRKRVLRDLDDAIARLDEFEPVNRDAIGFKKRRIEKGKDGKTRLVDDEWSMFNTLQDDFPEGAWPDAFVSKQFNEALRKEFGEKAGLRPVTEIKKAWLDLDKDARAGNTKLERIIVGINDKLPKHLWLHPPKGKGRDWSHTSVRDKAEALDRWFERLEEGKLTPAESATIEKIFRHRSRNWKEIQASIESKALGKIDEFAQEFHRVLDNEGVAEAFKRLFGSDTVDKMTLIGEIGKAPGVLKLLPDGPKGRAVFEELQGYVVENIMGPRKAVQIAAADVAAALNKEADLRAGTRMRGWIDENALAPNALSEASIVGDTPPAFVQQISRGEAPKSLPIIDGVSPKVLIRRLESQRSALRNKSKVPDLFDAALDNVISRLGRFEQIGSDFYTKFGLKAGDQKFYVPESFNTALRWDAIGRNITNNPVVSFMKKNLTARNFITFMNNIYSGVMLQFARTGKVINPFKYNKLFAAIEDLRHPIDPSKTFRAPDGRMVTRKERGRLVLEKLQKDNPKKFSKERLKFAEIFTDMKDFLDTGEIFEFDLESLASSPTTAAGKAGYKRLLKRLKEWTVGRLERGYSSTDQGFKLQEGIDGLEYFKKNFNDILETDVITKKRKNVGLKVGDEFKMEINSGQFETFKKVADIDMTNLDVVVATTRNQKGKLVGLTGNEMLQKMARAAALPANRVFVNYKDLVRFMAALKSPALQYLGVVAPFITWAYRAIHIPGVKRGIPGEILRPRPFLSTTSKALNKRLYRQDLSANMRQQVAIQLGREALRDLPPEELEAILARLPDNVAKIIITSMADEGYAEVHDIIWKTPVGPTGALFRVLQKGVIDPITKGELTGDNNEYFVKHWLGPDGGQNMFFNLRNDEGIRHGLSTEGGKLTPRGEELLELRKYIISVQKQPGERNFYDAAQLLALGGSPALEFAMTVDAARTGRMKEHRIKESLFRSFASTMAGGTVARLGDVGIGLADPTSPYSSRRREVMGPSGVDALKWAIRRVFGVGSKTVDTHKEKEAYMRKMKKGLRYGLVGEKSKVNSVAWALDQAKKSIENLEPRIKKKSKLMDKLSLTPPESNRAQKKRIGDELTKLESELEEAKTGIPLLEKKKEQLEDIINQEMYNFDSHLTYELNLWMARRRGKANKGRIRRPRRPMRMHKAKREMIVNQKGQVIGERFVREKEREEKLPQVFRVGLHRKVDYKPPVGLDEEVIKINVLKPPRGQTP
jgi:hypothetical protein